MKRRRGYTLSIIGLPGVGKTEFLLSCSQPIYLVAMDPNTREVVRKARKAAKANGLPFDVTVKYVIPPALAFDEREDIREEAQEKWDEFRDELRPIVKGEIDAATVGLDTGTELYNLGVLGAFGKSDQISPETRRNMMGPINSRWKGIIGALEQRGVNVVLLHRGSEKWEDRVEETAQGPKEVRHKMSGVFDVERGQGSFSGTGFIVSTEIILAHDPERGGKVAEQFGMKIVRSQQRPGLIGRRYWGTKTVDDRAVAKASFPYLSTLLYPDTTLDDWK